MVKFNVEDETGFLSSTEYLGATDDILEGLQNIEAQALSWGQFITNHGWLRVDLMGESTYPGADPLYWFLVVGPSGVIYQLAGKGPYGDPVTHDAIVVCSAATR